MHSPPKPDSPTSSISSVMEILQTLKHDDHGNSDHGAIVRYFEKLAKIELKRATP